MTGLEPAVTRAQGEHVDQLHHIQKFFTGVEGFEPPHSAIKKRRLNHLAILHGLF